MLKGLLLAHQQPVSTPQMGKIHLRMHAGNLSHGIFEPSTISIGSVVGELFFGFLEELDLLGKLPLHLAKLNLTLGGPFLQLGHLGLHLLDLLLQINHFVALKLGGVSRLEKVLAWRASSSLSFAVSAYESRALLIERLDAMRNSPRH